MRRTPPAEIGNGPARNIDRPMVGKNSVARIGYRRLWRFAATPGERAPIRSAMIWSFGSCGFRKRYQSVDFSGSVVSYDSQTFSLAGEIGGQVGDILLRKGDDHSLHDRVGALTRFVILQGFLQIILVLAG